MLERGLVHIYTGNGKGKTSSAVGLAVRAAGNDNSVLFYQFLKPPELQSGERTAIAKSGLNIELKCLDVAWDPQKPPSQQTQFRQAREEIAKALKEISAAAAKRDYDVVVLDEIVYCYSIGLVSLKDIQGLVKNKHQSVEIVMTGRSAKKELIELADLVTEMKKIKHPFDAGIKARRGIEF